MSRSLESLCLLALFVALSGGCDWFVGKEDDSSSAAASSRQTDRERDDSADEQTDPGDRHLRERHGGELGHHADDGDGLHHELDDRHDDPK